MTSRCLNLVRIVALLACAVAANVADASDAPRPRNVLFLMADDLRPEVRSFGSITITPHLDQLARRGMSFDRAYCQQALCNPSRSSMLTGLRPDSLGLWVNGTHFRELRPDAMTLPLWFQRQGYVTRNAGKIFHNWHTAVHGDPRSWSAPEFLHYANHGNDKPEVAGDPPLNLAKAPHCECRDVPDNAYYDGRVADEAVRILGEVKDKPFFLAVGFWKPHAPFNAPKKYWDLYQRDKLPTFDPSRPAGAPEVAFHDSRELRGAPPNQRDFTPEEAAEMRHGYFANVSYMDAQLGKVVDALDRLGLRESTMIVFVGDHGYHLGEHSLWAKTSCFELDARVPLIIDAGKDSKAGTRTRSLVELIDLFPTLVDLAGLPRPDRLEGASLRAVLSDPSAIVKQAVLTQHPRPAYYDRTPSGKPDFMGYSVRTDTLRYTEWRDPKTGAAVFSELYDQERDPNETRNLIGQPPDPDALARAKAHLRRLAPPAALPLK